MRILKILTNIYMCAILIVVAPLRSNEMSSIKSQKRKLYALCENEVPGGRVLSLSLRARFICFASPRARLCPFWGRGH